MPLVPKGFPSLTARTCSGRVPAVQSGVTFYLREVVLNAAMALPLVQRLAQRRHSTGINNDPSRAREVFEYLHGEVPVADRDVLEIGPGQTLRVLEYALDGGARSCTAVDVIDYFAAAPEQRGRVRLVIYDGSTLPVPDSSVDVIFSYNAFEHLRHPRVTVSECRRVLRPGGHLVCQVDLRDHYTSDEAKLADHLAHPTWLWNAMKWNRSAFTNRMRYAEWLQLLTASGFEITRTVPHRSAVLEREYRTGRFPARLSEDDVAITSFRATLRASGASR